MRGGAIEHVRRVEGPRLTQQESRLTDMHRSSAHCLPDKSLVWLKCVVSSRCSAFVYGAMSWNQPSGQ